MKVPRRWGLCYLTYVQSLQTGGSRNKALLPTIYKQHSKTRKTGRRWNLFWIKFTLFRPVGREKQTHTQNALLKSRGRIAFFHFPHSCLIVNTAVLEAAASSYQPESLGYFISLFSFLQLNLKPEDQGGKRFPKCRLLYTRPHSRFKRKVFLTVAK